jgi:hypothetical protein
MASATFENHPTDPDKVILRKPRHEDDDDIQAYVKPWVGLTNEDKQQLHTAWVLEGGFEKLCDAIETILKGKNT